MKLTRPVLKKIIRESIFDTQDVLAHASKWGETSAHVPLTGEQANAVMELAGHVRQLGETFSDVDYPPDREGDQKLPSMRFDEFATYLENLVQRGVQGQ